MPRPLKLILCAPAAVALVVLAGACGTQGISVPPSQQQLHTGAVLFSQRCAGCHTFSFAGTHGSASNVRTAQYNNGPSFNVRCERPITRVLYAIENGGFSGAIMPQNVVVGQDALDVAKFVATYSGRAAPRIPGVVICEKQPIGTIPTAAQVAAAAKSAPGATQQSAAAGTSSVSGTPGPGARQLGRVGAANVTAHSASGTGHR